MWPGNGAPNVRIFARVVIERPSQKGIVIGKGGEMIRRIGTLARQDPEGAGLQRLPGAVRRGREGLNQEPQRHPQAGIDGNS